MSPTSDAVCNYVYAMLNPINNLPHIPRITASITHRHKPLCILKLSMPLRQVNMPYRLQKQTNGEPGKIQKCTFYSAYRPCDHYKQRYCTRYRNPRQCCTCADSRPLRPDGRYPRYIDGTGWDRDAPRWANYCEGCQRAEKGYDILRSAIMVCEHWRKGFCSGYGVCCMCSDVRPQSHDGLYPLYVDGIGWVYGATRWQFYCQFCKDTREMEANAGEDT